MTLLVGILTALVLCVSLITGGVRTVAQITRMADSVDRMTETMKSLAATVGGLDARVGKLEAENIVKASRTRRTAG